MIRILVNKLRQYFILNILSMYKLKYFLMMTSVIEITNEYN